MPWEREDLHPQPRSEPKPFATSQFEIDGGIRPHPGGEQLFGFLVVIGAGSMFCIPPVALDHRPFPTRNDWSIECGGADDRLRGDRAQGEIATEMVDIGVTGEDIGERRWIE